MIIGLQMKCSYSVSNSAMKLPYSTARLDWSQQQHQLASDAIHIYDWSMIAILEGSLIFHFIETIFHVQSYDV